MESINQQLLEETISSGLIDKGRVWSVKEVLGEGSGAAQGNAEEKLWKSLKD